MEPYLSETVFYSAWHVCTQIILYPVPTAVFSSRRQSGLVVTSSLCFTFNFHILSPENTHPVAQMSPVSPNASAETNAGMLVISCRVEVALRAGEEQGQLQEVLPEAEGGPSAL